MILKGYKKTLEEEDMWDLIPDNRSENVVKKFLKNGFQLAKINKKKASKGESKINVFVPIMKTFWFKLIIITFIKLFATILTFGNPLLLDLLISYISPESIEPEWRGYFYAILMFVTPLLQSILNAQYTYLIALVGLKIRSITINVIYKKVSYIYPNIPSVSNFLRGFWPSYRATF